MANLEDLVRDLREKNSELVQEVQYWKTTAAQKDNEKLELIRDINELRLKLSRLRSGGEAQARKLETGLQDVTKDALTHLVKASGALTRVIELTNQYMLDRQELESSSARWSSATNTPKQEKVHRVPPLLIGGQSIQPVVSLNRTLLNPGTNARPANQNQTERAVPMHMLQDVYIPLIRIDMAEIQANNMEDEAEDSADEIQLEENVDQGSEESRNASDDFETTRRLDAVMEDVEPEDDASASPAVAADNPLEGPSWLLDSSSTSLEENKSNKSNQEPDSTTAYDGTSSPQPTARNQDTEQDSLSVTLAFTPTVRRRKRARTPPPASPAHAPHKKHGGHGRVLKVLVAKMRLSNESIGGGGDATPPKRTSMVVSFPKRVPPTSRSSTTDVQSPRAAENTQSPRRLSIDAESSPRRVTINVLSPPRRATIDAPSPPLLASDRSPPARRSTVDGQSPSVRNTTDTSPPRLFGSPPRLTGSPPRLIGSRPESESTPPRRPMRFDAPSPNGATDSGLIVFSETARRDVSNASNVSNVSNMSNASNARLGDGRGSRALSRDSDEPEGRSRRARKNVTYKEKPLNRKLRR